MVTSPQTTETVVDILSTLISIPSVNPMGQDVDGPIYFEGRVSDWLVGVTKLLLKIVLRGHKSA